MGADQLSQWYESLVVMHTQVDQFIKELEASFAISASHEEPQDLLMKEVLDKKAALAMAFLDNDGDGKLTQEQKDNLFKYAAVIERRVLDTVSQLYF